MNTEPQNATMDANTLYREDIITDRKIGTIRRLTPINAEGLDDNSRTVLYIGQAEIMTNMGPIPIHFELPGNTLTEAIAGFAAGAKAGIERTMEQIQEMRRQSASQLVVPQGGMPNLGAGPMPGRGGKIQFP